MRPLKPTHIQYMTTIVFIEWDKITAALPVELENVFVEVNDEVDYASAIILPRVNASSFKIEESIYTMLKVEGQFNNSTNNDPRQHLKNFSEVCNLHKPLQTMPLEDKAFNRIAIILDRIAKHNHAWHGGDQSGGLDVVTPSLSHLIDLGHNYVPKCLLYRISSH
ncbi:hypothetical protein HAX54_052155, partial [Datura stramonium]|nr:hypothetical protein [Datura stramonium]